MGMLHQLALDAFGIGGRKMLKRIVGLNPKPQAYKDYRQIMKSYEKTINETSCTNISISKTCEEVATEHGFQRETLETLQNVEFLEKFHKFLASKGYELPKSLGFMEKIIPSQSSVKGVTWNKKDIIYNPRRMMSIDFRIPIHETGHLMHKKGYSYFRDKSKFNLGKLLHKLGLFKDKSFHFLTKKEQEILADDLRRAWNEGYFKHNPSKEAIKETMFVFCKTEKDKKLVKKSANRAFKDLRKHPEKHYISNMLFTRGEFVADYFNLSARGFKFSPEITAKYEKFGGPKIKEIITEQELQKLEQLRKAISKKSLSDYGYSMSV